MFATAALKVQPLHGLAHEHFRQISALVISALDQEIPLALVMYKMFFPTRPSIMINPVFAHLPPLGIALHRAPADLQKKHLDSIPATAFAALPSTLFPCLLHLACEVARCLPGTLLAQPLHARVALRRESEEP
jgi:hypothetical protein